MTGSSKAERIVQTDHTVIQVKKISITPDADNNKTQIKQSDATRIAVSDKTLINPTKAVSPASQDKKNISSQIEDKTVLASVGKKTGSATLNIGDTIKQRFVLIELLGTGGMGKVFKALDLRKQEAQDKEPYIAVKVLNDEFKEHPESLIALQREARKSQQLAHPNIVNVHDFDRDGNSVFMTMELLKGQSLDRIIADEFPQGMPMDMAQGIIVNICDALIYAHKHHIIHADLKPANIFVTENNVAKIFDFGIARACQSSQLAQEQVGTDKTLFDPTALGALTPTYASKEMLEGQAPDASDDLYSICCVFYELLTGRHPFGRKSAQEAELQSLGIKKIKGIDKTKAQALYKGLSFDRKNRIPDIQSFKEAFCYKRRSKWVYTSALLALIIVSVGVFYPQIKLFYEQSKHQQFFHKVNNLAHNTSSQEQPLTQYVNQYIANLDEGAQEFVLSSIKPVYIASVKNQIDQLLAQSQEQDKYNTAYRLLEQTEQYYPDSATLEKLSALIDNDKFRYLNLLNTQFNELLESAQYSFFSDPDEVTELKNIMGTIRVIDPEHALLKDERLLLIFQGGIDQAINHNDLEQAEYLLQLSGGLFKDNLILKNLTDKFNLHKKRLEEEGNEQQLNMVENEGKVNIPSLKEQLEDLIKQKSLNDDNNNKIMAIVTTLEQYLGRRSRWLSEKKQTLSRLYLDHSINMREQGRLVESRRYLEEARQFNPSIYGLSDEETILSAMENIEQVKHKAKQRLANINGLKTTLGSQLKAYNMEDALRTYQRLERILGRNDPYISGEAKQEIASRFYQLAQQQFKSGQFSEAKIQIKQGLDIQRQHSGLRNLLKQVNKKISLQNKSRQLEQLTAQAKQIVEKVDPVSTDKANDNQSSTEQRKIVGGNKDRCLAKYAGYGKRKRAQCFDYIDTGTGSTIKAPLLVVVPPLQKGESGFAITRYEVTKKEYALYCKKTGACQVSSGSLPITNITDKQAKAYAQWLSKVTGEQYALPTRKQWSHAIKAKNTYKPVDVNCRIYFGSKLLKGQNIVDANMGESNPWGVLNGIGNVREYVIDGAQTGTIGGAYTDPVKDCISNNYTVSNGQGDAITGFRVVRKVRM